MDVGPTGRGRVNCSRRVGSRLLWRGKSRWLPVAGGRALAGSRGFKGQGCRSDGRFTGGFSQNT